MPPLAHILAPQITQRVNQIDEDLGRAGYLAHSSQANVGFEKTPYDPRGVINKPDTRYYNPKAPGAGFLAGIGMMQRSGDPIAQRVAKGFLAGGVGKVLGKQGAYVPPQAGQSVDPKRENDAKSMVAPSAPATPRAKPGKLQLKKGEAVGIDETGESVDRKGKKMGYLTSPAAPMGTVNGMPLRDTARRQKDILISSDKGTLMDQDVFGANALKQLYEPHLKAMQDHFGDTGREEFPPGYFKGMSPEQQRNIELGVKALRAMERGQPT